jgi:GntR family transcriptional regulator
MFLARSSAVFSPRNYPRLVTAHPLPPEWVTDVPDLADDSPVPAHVRIERWLTDVIGRGDLVVGDRLPPEGELAALLGVSRMTLRQALGRLETIGTVVRKPGRSGGTFVDEPKIVCDLTGLAGFTEQMRRANVRAGARVITATTRPAGPAVATGLGIERGDPVHEVIRIRTANREPLALERAYFPAAVFPGLVERRLTGSIYALLTRAYGHKPATAAEALEAVIAGPEEARLLHIEPQAPLMQIERTAYTAAGLAVEYARDLFRPDKVRISLRTGLSV